ncbi:MAG: GNAT family N-acetyltransferase [Campylobacterota bacterium]|nr:GNAT family N-acetyltransferase [Campylobacterota bacterium]
MAKIVSLSSIPRSQFDKIKKQFKCSYKELEEHIKQYAYSHQKEGLFQTYLYIDDNNYAGYISFAITSIDKSKANNKINIPPSINYEVSSLKITRLCIFDGYLNNGIGKSLLGFANILAVTLQKTVGCRAIIVDSKIEAIGFYDSFGFIQIAMQDDDTTQTAFMVYDLFKPSELENDVLLMIEFCEEYEQGHLIPLLNN